MGIFRSGMSKTRTSFFGRIAQMLGSNQIDDDTWDDLEALLIQADVGVKTTADVMKELRNRAARENMKRADQLHLALRDALLSTLKDPPVLNVSGRPLSIILIVGVNGSGKTTTIAKLANLYKGEGRKVMLAAGDTFRAAAVEQLKVWGDRAGVPVVSKGPGADAAGLAYEALERARAENCDVLLIDTAGRLHNKTNLMDELAKVVRVIRKLDPASPHSCLLVLDATTGQNAHAQVETFKNMSPVDALVLTKLDGSAKGGVLVALAEKFGLPVVAIGVGEGIDDLRPFEARAFARGLMGLTA